jgi:hypothetical protein
MRLGWVGQICLEEGLSYETYRSRPLVVNISISSVLNEQVSRLVYLCSHTNKQFRAVEAKGYRIWQQPCWPLLRRTTSVTFLALRKPSSNDFIEHLFLTLRVKS